MKTRNQTNRLLIILIFAVLGFIGLYLYKNTPSITPDPVVPPEISTTTPSVPATPINTNISSQPNTDNQQPPATQSTWTTYEDPGLGFALEYPQDIFDAEPQGRGVEGGGVLLVAPDHSVPSDFSGQHPEKRQNLSIKFTMEGTSMKNAIAARQLEDVTSIPFSQAGYQGKIFQLGAEGLNVQYGFLVLDNNTTMVVEFHYFDKSVFGYANAEEFSMEQQIEIFYSVLSKLKIG